MQDTALCRNDVKGKWLSDTILPSYIRTVLYPCLGESEDFSKPKVMYPNMTKFMPFYYDERGFYQNYKSFMITGTHVSYLAAFLNSSLFKFCFRDNFPELLGGTRELRKIFFDKIPVKKVSDSVNDTFRCKVNKIQSNYTKE